MSEDLQPLAVIAAEIVENLEAALSSLQRITRIEAFDGGMRQAGSVKGCSVAFLHPRVCLANLSARVVSTGLEERRFGVMQLAL